jgi:hypothetical protein
MIGVLRQTFTKTILLLGLLVFSFTLQSNTASATTGINQQVNFQGRLLNAQGATVPDGYYNIQFNIYKDGDGQSVGDTTGAPTGSLLWTESHLNNVSQGVRVVNGYLSVQLGAITAFGSSVDWNQNTLWLSMNIGSTAPTCTPFTSCTPDGEMTPMKRLSASPYSLNSGLLGGIAATGFIQNTTTVQSANIAVQSSTSGNIAALIQGAVSQTADIFQVKANGVATPLLTVAASGKVGIGNTATSGYALDVTGDINSSTQYRINGVTTITNSALTFSGASTSNVQSTAGQSLNLSGSTLISLQTNGITRATLDNANNIYFGNGVTAAAPNSFDIFGTGSSMTAVAGAALNIQGGSATVGNANGGNITLAGGTGIGTGTNGAINIGTSVANTVTIGNTTGASAIVIQGGTGGVSIGNSTANTTPNNIYGNTLIKTPSTNSTTAFQVQNASSKNIATVDTTNGQLLLGTSGSGGVNGTITFSNTAGTNTAGFGLAANPSASYTLLLPTTIPGGGQCLKAGNTNVYQMSFGNCITPTTPQFVQQAVNTNTTTTTTLATTIAATATTNLLIAQVAVNTGTAVVSSITDTAGNTWVKATSGSGNSLDSEIWYTANSNSVTSVTVNMSGSYRVAVNISEFAGMATASALDVATGNTNTGGTTQNSPTITTTVAYDLVIAGLSWATGPSMTGSSTGAWNDLTTLANPASLSSRYKTGTATGSYSTSWTASYYTNASTSMAAFKPVGGGADYAEEYGTSDPSIQSGDVVAVDTTREADRITNQYGQDDSKAWIVKASKVNQKNTIGIVSTAPSQTIGKVFNASENPRPVALSGRVPVKVNTENGTIQVGDRLTASSTPGVAMKATGPGMTIGTSMSKYDNADTGAVGSVIVFINNSYYGGDESSILSLGSSTNEVIPVDGSSTNNNLGSSSDGTSSIQGATNLTHNLTIQNVAGVNLFKADVSSMSINVGNGVSTLVSSGNGDLFVSGNIEAKGTLRIGDAQNGFNITAGIAPSSLAGIYSGTNRPVRTISEVPAFNGLVADDNANGSLTTSFDNTPGAFHSYYQWTSSDLAQQTKQMHLRIPVPRDWSDFTSDNQICYNVWTDNTLTTKVNTTFFDTTGASKPSYDASPTVNNVWQRKCTNSIGGVVTVNGDTYITIDISLSSYLGSSVKFGEFSLDYLSAF